MERERPDEPLTGPHGQGPLSGVRILAIEQMQLGKFNGTSWELFGPVISGEVGS